MPATKHTILFLAANPRDTAQLALDQECAAIERALQRTAFRDRFELHSKWAVDANAVMRHLNELAPTIIHFSGHGSGKAAPAPSRDLVGSAPPSRDVSGAIAPGCAGIVLQAPVGSALVTDQALAQMIATASPPTRLVVLNACYSAGLADTLCEAVACVVGMDGAIEDRAARSFAVAFYRALGEGGSVGAAVAQATAALVAEASPTLPVCRPRDGVNADELVIRGR